MSESGLPRIFKILRILPFKCIPASCKSYNLGQFWFRQLFLRRLHRQNLFNLHTIANQFHQLTQISTRIGNHLFIRKPYLYEPTETPIDHVNIKRRFNEYTQPELISLIKKAEKMRVSDMKTISKQL